MRFPSKFQKTVSRKSRIPYTDCMVRFALILALLFSMLPLAEGQWALQQSPTTADLRAIDNIGNGIAWASGTNGAILRTTDSGANWQLCTVPPGADHFDFRAIQAFDAETAFVMSSGKGDLSRLYKTSDGCRTWTLFFTNPDADGSFDSLRATYRRSVKNPLLMLLGDPVQGQFRLWTVKPFAASGKSISDRVRLNEAMKGETISSASNSSLFVIIKEYFLFGTGGPEGARIIRRDSDGEYPAGTAYSDVPIGGETSTSGVSSIAVGTVRGSTLHWWWRPSIHNDEQFLTQKAVAVGGDYRKPDDASDIAAYCDGIDSVWKGMVWHAALTQPHGYRSAVAYDSTHSAWITVGPNGTDVSFDDGKNWKALHPDPAFHEEANADKDWNALSLPFAVGPSGRIGLLRDSAVATK